MVVQERRVSVPMIPLLEKELLRLRIMPNGKIDHPRSGSKDLADATSGAIFNAISHTRKDSNDTVEIVTAESLRQDLARERAKALDDNIFRPEGPNPNGVIRPPKSNQPMPSDLGDWIDGLRLI